MGDIFDLAHEYQGTVPPPSDRERINRLEAQVHSINVWVEKQMEKEASSAYPGPDYERVAKDGTVYRVYYRPEVSPTWPWRVSKDSKHVDGFCTRDHAIEYVDTEASVSSRVGPFVVGGWRVVFETEADFEAAIERVAQKLHGECVDYQTPWIDAPETARRDWREVARKLITGEEGS